MAVEAIVVLMEDKLNKLLRDKGGQLLGVDGEIKHIRDELKQMRCFLKDADIKQKEDEAVRDWMEDIRDICFDVDDVIDILGQGQAAQGRHGFVERLKRCISDQITGYKVGKEIERIKLNIKGISRSRESYGIRKINEERQETPSLTKRLQEDSEVITRADDQLTNEERTRDIDEGRQEEQLINEEEPSPCDGTRDIDEGRLEASSSAPGLKGDRVFSTLPGDAEDVDLQEGINTVGQQSIKEEPGPYDGTRDIDEGRLEASSSAPSSQADRQISTLLGESEKVGFKEEIDTVSEQLIKEEEPSPCDGTRDIDEGRLEASSSDSSISTLLGESEEVGVQEIDTGSEQLMEPSPFDGTRGIHKGRQEKNLRFLGDSPSRERATKEQKEQAEARKRYVEDLIDSTQPLPGLSRRSVPLPSEKIEKANTRVDDQLTNEERTRDIDEGRQEASSTAPSIQADRYEGSECRDGSKDRAYYHHNVQGSAAIQHVQSPQDVPMPKGCCNLPMGPPGNNQGWINVGGHNSGGNNPQIQGGNSGVMTFGPGGNIYHDYTQTDGGGNNPQIQGVISAGTRGNINLGLQGANVRQFRKFSGGGNINTGNQGYGGGKANSGTQG